MSSHAMAWNNQVTGETDWIEGFPSDLRPYLPQDPVVIKLFECYLDVGEAPEQAFIKVCRAYLGEKNQ